MKPTLWTSLAAIIVLAGCAPTMPQADRRFGQEVRTLFAAQALPAAAGRDLPGQDGASARAALAHYRQSLRGAPAAAPSVVITPNVIGSAP
jgi:hypothetical protein